MCTCYLLLSCNFILGWCFKFLFGDLLWIFEGEFFLQALLFLLDYCLYFQNQCMDSKKHQSFVSSFANFLISYAQNNRDKAATILHPNVGTLRSAWNSIWLALIMPVYEHIILGYNYMVTKCNYKCWLFINVTI